jgi:hypothetical protein
LAHVRDDLLICAKDLLVETNDERVTQHGPTREPKIDQWFRRSFVAVATSIALTEFRRQLFVECHFLDNRFVVTAITSAEVKV